MIGGPFSSGCAFSLFCQNQKCDFTSQSMEALRPDKDTVHFERLKVKSEVGGSGELCEGVIAAFELPFVYNITGLYF